MKEYYAFSHTAIGYSHISAQKPCQDYSMHYRDDRASVILVSDGHGSANFTRSDRGSRFACEASREAVDEFLRNMDAELLEDPVLREAAIRQLCKNILLRWNARVEADAAEDPFTDEEVEKVSEKYKLRYLSGECVEHAYGCTLIVAIVTGDYFLALRNGDGQCVAVDGNGSFTTPIPWNDNCEFNVTTSLCDSEAIDNFRYCYETRLPAAVFIGSDGVDDSYASVEELYHLYRNICLRALEDGAQAAAERVEQLLPEITRRGSTDDVSVAGMMDLAALEGAREWMELAISRRQMQLEQARREQRKRILIRDIKVAEKKRSRAMAQREKVQERIQGAQERKNIFLEQIFAFRRQADACSEDMTALTREEQQLTDVINGADCELDRLRTQLLALDADAEAPAPAEAEAPAVWGRQTEDAFTQSDDFTDREENDPVDPDSDGTAVAE